MPYTYTPSSASVSAVQGSSSDHASTTAQQGSTGTRTPQGHSQRQPPCRAEYRDEKRKDRMKHDLLGIGSQFDTNK
ncbi:hypothetical protein FJTKL_12163 [Diaporthe vaccinii]|uniref:Uncharacterized protein n=1 Tax=Diaporthe vaccinii TaxID=105482 RepID=A0ABR4EEH9_9PEZI